jgi:hypothetical protein
MCIEDIRIGRKTKVSQFTVEVGIASTQLVASDSNRVAIRFSNPITNRVTISMRESAVDLNGMIMFPSGNPLALSLGDDGMIVTREFNAIANVAPEFITMWIVSLEEE